MNSPVTASSSGHEPATSQLPSRPSLHDKTTRVAATEPPVPTIGSGHPGRAGPGDQDGRHSAWVLIQATLRLGIAAHFAAASEGHPRQSEEIARLLGALDVVQQRTQTIDRASIRARYERLLSASADPSARAATIEAWNEGRSLPLIHAVLSAVRAVVDYVHAHSSNFEQPSGGATRLTHRERQVLELLARGLSDREIAIHLSISPHTASTHVKRVRAKLGGGTRAATIWRALWEIGGPFSAPTSS